MTADAAAPALREVVALLRDALATAPRRFGGLVALSIVSAALESAALMLLPVVLGGPVSAPGLPALGPVALGGLYLALVGLAAAALYGQATESEALIRRFGERLRTRLHEAVLGAAWGTPALAHPNELQHAIFAEAGQCAFAVRLGIDLVGRLVTLPALLVAALVLSPGVTLAVGAMALVLGLPTLRLARRAYRLSGTLVRENRALAATLADELAGLKPIKVLRAEAARGLAFAARLEALGRATTAQARATAGVRAWQRLATACAVAGGAGYGLAVMELDGASMIALAVAALRLASGGMQVVETWRQLSRLLPIYEQVRRREADCLAVGEPAAAPTVPRLRRSLSFAAVAYAHPGASDPTLSGIDLVLPARGVTALVGPSGAGKSTLVDLAMGLIAPTAGVVAVDDVALGAADRVAWRARVAYVPQDGFLFHDTVRANLAVAAPTADDAALARALRRAAADFALALPEGLDTRVGDRGSRLSGGERQRIMIARAFLQDADLVVFDESTSALDADTEARVLAAVADLARGACVILVAHRPAAIALADRVVQLDGGRIVAVREGRAEAR